MYSTIQRLNKGKMNEEEWDSKMKAANKMVEFGVKVCTLVQELGGTFVFEHPRHASSWSQRALRDLARREGVYRVNLDMCRFGLQAIGEGGVAGPVKKPTSLLTNSLRIVGAMSRRCKGCEWHVRLMGGRLCSAATEYTPTFCKALLSALGGATDVTVDTLPGSGQRGEAPWPRGGARSEEVTTGPGRQQGHTSLSLPQV